ncbi:MAG: hypothetical protein AVDCRST_MAG53-3488 [uncultured Solirubrobacteraceae bacterium]|uniref:Uncharacterized protein n=1 Tax=uncultured Solirubrobacteraceae bacterium TaxID=1162706 RepID=A0A6J4TDD8_9ACTN|nr:MAG: hypothetical protein AVDCRST_MAG53-3488 [uncultured Solirubrobacteraceae bacterium]
MTRTARQLAAGASVLAALLAGGWLWGAVVAPGLWSAVALLVAWFLVIGFLTTRLSRRRPELKLALRGTYLAAAVTALALGYLTSVRETVVDEPLVTGAPASQATPPGAPASSVEDLLAPQP